ncbi:MAG: hypothetical protein ACRD2Q_00620 [Terriglobales bacterium]
MMEEKLRVLRVIHVALLLSCLLYAYIGKVVGPKEPGDVQIFLIAFAFLGVTDVGIAMVLRSRIVGSAEEVLRQSPADALALQRWMSGHFIGYAMAEAVALFGLVLRMLGGTLVQALPFYGAAVLLLLMWMPRKPE